MKKNLLVLALAATTFSGAAMAWTANGHGGSMEFGGTLTPKEMGNPWESKVGDNVTELNGSLKSGEKKVEIILTKAIPVLSIRTAEKAAFMGGAGITPQINFNGLIDTARIIAGRTVLQANVMNADNPAEKIGTLNSVLSTAGFLTRATSEGESSYFSLSASLPAHAFFGGVSTVTKNTAPNAQQLITMIFPEALENIDYQTSSPSAPSDLKGEVELNNPLHSFSAAYAAGIERGNAISIALDAPATSNLKWKASLPVTVSYQ